MLDEMDKDYDEQHKQLTEARAEVERLKAPALNASLLREKLAELAHNQWAGWMEYLFFKSKQVDGCVVIPAWANERWRRQVATRYADLSEEEKDSDRSEADKFLAVFNAQLAERDKLIDQMREALQEAMVLCDAVPTRAHDMAKDYHLREIGRIVNVKGLYQLIKAALSAAERATK